MPLAAGWKLARIGDVFEFWGGHTPSKSNAAYWGEGLPWFSSQDVKTQRLARSAYSVTRKALAETGLRVCPAGSVVVVVRSGILAHTLPVAVTTTDAVINQGPESLLLEAAATERMAGSLSPRKRTGIAGFEPS
jgi:type I restriction enzyme S subunit